MPVSFDPDWQTASTSSSTSLAVTPPSGGAVQVATVLVGNNRTLTGLSGFSSVISGASSGTVGIRYYHLVRAASADAISFGFSSSAFALAVVGAYPAGTYERIEPHSFTDVPGVPGEQYANPNAFVDGASITLAYVPEWVPTDGGRVAGWLHDATDAGTEQADLTIVTPDGDIDVSSQVELNTSGVWTKLVGFALESNENPAELRISETPSTSSSSRRILGVLGGMSGNPWTVGRVAWGTRGAWH